MNPASVIRNRFGSVVGALNMNEIVRAVAPKYAIAGSAFSSSFFVSEKNSNNPAASASTAIVTKIQTVSGIYDGSTMDAINIGSATAAVRILVFIFTNCPGHRIKEKDPVFSLDSYKL